MKKKDVVLIGIILLAAVLGLGGFHYWQNADRNTHLIAVITHNDTVIKRIDLDNVEQTYTITVEGDFHNHIRVEKGRIRFEESDCPHKICVLTDWLTKYGDIAVCLPNKTIIEISDGTQ